MELNKKNNIEDASPNNPDFSVKDSSAVNQVLLRKSIDIFIIICS